MHIDVLIRLEVKEHHTDILIHVRPFQYISNQHESVHVRHPCKVLGWFAYYYEIGCNVNESSYTKVHGHEASAVNPG